MGAAGVECPGAFALHWRPQPTKAAWPQLCLSPGFPERPWKGLCAFISSRAEGPPALLAPGPRELHQLAFLYLLYYEATSFQASAGARRPFST